MKIVIIVVCLYIVLIIIRNKKNKPKNISIEKKYNNKYIKQELDIINGKNEKTVIKDIKQIIESEPEEEKFKKSIIYKDYKLPSIELLTDSTKDKPSDHKELEEVISKIEGFYKENKISLQVVEVNIGPIYITYEVKLAPGTRIDDITKLNQKIEQVLGQELIDVDISQNISNAISITLKKKELSEVSLKEVLKKLSIKSKENLIVPIGLDIYGKILYLDLMKTNNIYITGAPATGKSTLLNDMIISMLMYKKPDELNLILIDPNRIELGSYNGIPHLLSPVIIDSKRAIVGLKKVVSEIEKRYELLEESKLKSIKNYNNKIEDKNKKLPEEERLEKMPYILVIIDDLTQLYAEIGNEFYYIISSIANKGNRVGVQLIVSSKNGMSKQMANTIKDSFNTHLYFNSSSVQDPYLLNNMKERKELSVKGEALLYILGESELKKVQCPIVKEQDIIKVVDYVSRQNKITYNDFYMDETVMIKNDSQAEDYDDSLYNDVVNFVISTGTASTSLLQRRFKLGYNRAARMIDLLEEKGIIGPQTGTSKSREVLVSLEDNDEIL